MQTLKKMVFGCENTAILRRSRYQFESGSNQCLFPILLDPVEYPQLLFSSDLHQLTVYPHFICHIFWYALSIHI